VQTSFGIALIVLLAAMGTSWASRRLVLQRLRIRHPRAFESLGRPTERQLTSLLPKNNETQLRFQKFLWGGACFELDDRRLAILAGTALASDVVLVASAAVLLWSASR
jgi:hypothetical protein